MHTFFTDEALLDIDDAVLWYENQRKGLSHDFELCLEAAVNEISRNPEAYQKRYKQVKIKFLPRFPYGIHYLSENEQIIIIGLFHSSRSPQNWNSRL